MDLEERGYTDGRGVLPEEGAHDEGGCLAPPLEGGAIGIGVGEEENLMSPEGVELIDLYFSQSSCGEPQALRVLLAEDERAFLGFYYTYGPVGGVLAFRVTEEMKAEEAVGGGVGAWRCVVTTGEEGGYPGGMMGFVFHPMTVGMVVHDLTVVDTSFVVYLPEDHTTLFGAADEITAGGMEHLFMGEKACMDDCFAELVIDRLALLPEVGGGMGGDEHR